MSAELSSLLGSANLNFADGNYTKAIDELKQFVQVAPTIPDPYFTLAMVYESLNDTAKALSFYHIAAALTPEVRICTFAWVGSHGLMIIGCTVVETGGSNVMGIGR